MSTHTYTSTTKAALLIKPKEEVTQVSTNDQRTMVPWMEYYSVMKREGNTNSCCDTEENIMVSKIRQTQRKEIA
jgi:hypothetical protein